MVDARKAEGEHRQEHGEDDGAADGPGSTLPAWRSGRFIKASGGGRRSPVPGAVTCRGAAATSAGRSGPLLTLSAALFKRLKKKC
jgi:hypothetical protein